MIGWGYGIPSLAMRRVASSGQVVTPPPTSFSPQSTNPSAWFDPSDISTLHQDDAGATPVSSTGQTIGQWGDKSANAINLLQANSALRPTYQSDGTLHWVETDGVDDAMASTPIPASLGLPLTMVFGYQMMSTAGSVRGNIAELSRNATNGVAIGFRPDNDQLYYYSRMKARAVAGTNTFAPSVHSAYERHVVTMQSTPGNISVRLNGEVILDAPQALASETTGDQSLRIGVGLMSFGVPAQIRLYGLQVWSSAGPQPDASQIADLEAWMAEKSGVTLA